MMETPATIANHVGMMIRISRTTLTELLAQAAVESTEICGLLLGRDNVVERVSPTRNVAADPACRFEIDPAALIAAHRASRGGGPAVLGHYHSHPSGVARPSAMDAASAHADGAIWLIIGSGEATAWVAGEAGLHGRFSPCAIDLMADD